MITASAMIGNGEFGWMVTGPLPMPKLIVSAPASAFASIMAARKVHSPGVAVWQTPSPGLASTASAVLLTVKPTAPPPARATL